MAEKIRHFPEYFSRDFTFIQTVNIDPGTQEISRGSVNFQHH